MTDGNRIIEPVRFRSGENALIGRLFRPVGAKGYPVVIVTGAWMTVKEQMPDRYAREMVKRGFAALTFDFTGWGESEGSRRQFEDPETKIADISAAAAFLAEHDDAGPIGGLGICASSGYMVHAASRKDAGGTIRSVSLVAPWLHDREVVQDIYGGENAVQALIAQGEDADRAYRSTGRQIFVPAASLDDRTAIMGAAPYYTEQNRGLIPEWRNEADPGFWEGWLQFDAVTVAERFTKPFLMIESEAAAAPQGARKFFEKLEETGRSILAREVWLDGISQFDFYDRDDVVNTAADEAAAHFEKTLL